MYSLIILFSTLKKLLVLCIFVKETLGGKVKISALHKLTNIDKLKDTTS